MSDSTRKFAVVTGASSGIGLELAKQFASNGFDVLIASEGNELAEAANEISTTTGADVPYVPVDLATSAGVEDLFSAIQKTGRPLDAIAINAGVGVAGAFVDTDLEAEMNIVDLNVASVVHLAKLVVRDMVSRGSGRILFTSSIAGTMPSPYQTVYGASKAFVRYFAQGLREELKETGVSVTALMPGATETNFFVRANAEDTKLGQSKKDDAAEVAKQGFEALMKGEDHIVAGSFSNKLQAAAGHVLPDPVMASQMAKAAKPGSGD